ncbi:hypothetical protein AB0G35_00360 [Streptomyces sp. NPDC021749]|uniref:hypothetical protein n=1 Tax=Streptomyces sp. NPDC021749 TaxID=3154905 RepID=UPI0033EB8ED7
MTAAVASSTPSPGRGRPPLAALTGTAGSPKRPTPLRSLPYPVRMIIGMPAAAAGTCLFAEREATRCD